MKLVAYESLPDIMKNDKVKEYYEILSKKKLQLLIKRLIDILGSIVGIVFLSPFMLIISAMIKYESNGPILFKQKRITQFGREFFIYKFRTMIVDAEKVGAQVTSKNDPRVTKVGKLLRKCRLDELPQIFNIFKGELTFVGTRPEVPKYVSEYSKEMLATLLLPAGVTSECSILFKDEEKILDNSKNVDEDYINKVLPLKMKYNLQYTKAVSVMRDFKVIIKTIGVVFGKEYTENYS